MCVKGEEQQFDLIPFPPCSAQSKSEKATTTGTRTLGNQVIRKGHMCIQNLGIMKGNGILMTDLCVSYSGQSNRF